MVTTSYDPFKELDAAHEASASIQRIRRGRNQITRIEGLEHMPGLAALTRRLKSTLATGGTIRHGAIELQGDQAPRVARFLHEEGISTHFILPASGEP